MRVAVHVGQLFGRVPGGIGRYVAALVSHLEARQRATGGEERLEVVTFAAARPDGRVPVSMLPGYHDLGPPRGRWRHELWHRFRAPAVHVDADVVHAPSLAVPPTGRRPLVVTVHDLAFVRHPGTLTPRGVRFHRRGLELARAGAAAVIVPSRFVAGELEGAGFDLQRVFVAPHGVDPPAPRGEDDVDAALGRLGLARPYVLGVGTLEPRKGVDVLVDAFGRLRRRHPGLRLALAGPWGWGHVEGLDAPGVRVLGTVSDDDLDALYRGAVGLALPSRYEGFGLPALEAMARGCPVVASSVASLPEVVGEAGVLVAPGDPADLADALERLLTDDELRSALRDRGRRRATEFTWAASVARHLEAYEAARRAPRRRWPSP